MQQGQINSEFVGEPQWWVKEQLLTPDMPRGAAWYLLTTLKVGTADATADIVCCYLQWCQIRALFQLPE